MVEKDLSANNGVNMKILKTQIDKDFEDDGLFSVTFWVECTPPRYISISRDVLEDPNCLYFEAEDQIYGIRTVKLDYNLFKDTLVLTSTDCDSFRFHWTNETSVQLELNHADQEELSKTLSKIFEISQVRKM